MAKRVSVIVGVCVVALVASAQPDGRAKVDTELALSVAQITACGKQFKAVYDWRAFDAIDWKGNDRDPNEFFASERPNVRGVGQGLDRACASAELKAALAKVDTIVYRPTAVKGSTLSAVISGKTITFTNYIFGSTRETEDFRVAAAAAAMPKPTASPTVKPAAAGSSKVAKKPQPKAPAKSDAQAPQPKSPPPPPPPARSNASGKIDHMDPDGDVYNAQQDKIGHIDPDGDVYNAKHDKIGHIDPDGDIYNANLDKIGHIDADGDVYNANLDKIGSAPGVPQHRTAAVFFFFRR